jgi:DNA-binding MltR family transcriptional regulator
MLKLFDIAKKKTTFEVQLTIPSLIGRLICGLCRINNGHIYTNNNLIKMRLDLINNPKNYRYRDQELFDFYYNIFDLEENTVVRSGTPIDSIRYHRFVFFTRDSSF